MHILQPFVTSRHVKLRAACIDLYVHGSQMLIRAGVWPSTHFKGIQLSERHAHIWDLAQQVSVGMSGGLCIITVMLTSNSVFISRFSVIDFLRYSMQERAELQRVRRCYQ